jgi:acetyl esterase/lipase
MKKSYVVLLCLMFSCLYAFSQTKETNNYQYFERLADSLLNKNEKEAAIINYKKALSIFPNSWKSYNSLRNLGSEVSSDTIAVWLQKLIPSHIDYLPNIVYGIGGNRDLRLSILRPKEIKNKRLPVIFYIHGGGWQQNIKELGIVPLMQFVNRGYIGVAVEYRLSKEAKFPAQIEDIKCAIRFLRANAHLYSIDTSKIGVFGESAGGHLAALVGTSCGIKSLEGNGGWGKFSSSVQAVCDWSGPTYFPADTITKNATYNLLGGTTLDKADLAKKASPLTYITTDDPPFLIFHGTSDNVVKMEQSATLYQALRKANVEATLKLFEGGGHFAVYGALIGEISGGMPNFRNEMKNLMNDFFDKYLKK